jgi:uncharacterized protein (TIGR02145 family)
MKTKRFSLKLLFFATTIAAFSLAACGDTDVGDSQSGLFVASEVSKLPECTAENEGDQAVVKGESVVRVCLDGKWTEMGGTGNADFSCKTEELKDRSGLKIVCNGDSVGVVKNGTNGENGASSEGCSVTAQTDSTVTIACGKETTTIPLGGKTSTEEDDPERQPTSMESLVGYTQKGPFVRGSTVYLYELESGRTLKQTNGNFTSNILSDDGRYRFLARDLVSQYAMLVVDGNYRNEVTGKVSDNTIRLKAFTDLSKHTSANVNLLTHLEFERVYYLVTKMKKKLYEAKAQAQGEILDIFHIKLKDKTDAEDMDVFGDGDADAALLAISILLQGDRTEADLMALLAEISDEIAELGVWKGSRADSIKASIADWAFSRDLSLFRKNVEDWGLSKGKPVGGFEKLIETYIAETYGVDTCSAKDNGQSRKVNNKSSRLNGKTFHCNEGRLVQKIPTTYLNPDIPYGEIEDRRNRKVYKTVTIGGVTWMAQNLDYADSVIYPSIRGGSLCYDNNPENCDIYGRLYKWGTAMDSAAVFTDKAKGCGSGKTCSISVPARGICPEGWHIPTPGEWESLYSAVGSVPEALQAKGFEGLPPYTIGNQSYSSWDNATDAYGFSILPDGCGMALGIFACIWSAAEHLEQNAAYWTLLQNYASIEESGTASNHKYTAYNSVRCVKD